MDLDKKRFKTLLERFEKRYVHFCGGEGVRALFARYKNAVEREMEAPYTFSNHHQKERVPIDFAALGREVIAPCIGENSFIHGEESLDWAEKWIREGGNIFFLGNHQVEPDPQIIISLLEKKWPYLAEKMHFMAGARVLTDPLAVPFSRGTNLFSIHSRQYFDVEPESKAKKVDHNAKTIRVISSLLDEGGMPLYVALSGGRDRVNPDTGILEIAQPDPQSLRLFQLLQRKSASKTAFLLLTLFTHPVMPPPASRQREIGEERCPFCADIFIALSEPYIDNEAQKMKVMDVEEMLRMPYTLFRDFIEEGLRKMEIEDRNYVE